MIVSLIKDMYIPDVTHSDEWDLEDCYNAFKCFEDENVSKETSWLFSTWELKDGTKRMNGDNASQIHALVLDFDTDAKHKPNIKETYEFMKFNNLQFLLYTTHSHTKEAPRFRVIIPLASPIPASDFITSRNVYKKMFSELGVDESSYNIGKHFKLPGPNAKYILDMNGQKLISKIKPTVKKNFGSHSSGKSSKIQKNPKEYVEKSEGFYEGNRNNWVCNRIFALQNQGIEKSIILSIMKPYIDQLSPTEQRTFDHRIKRGNKGE